MNHNNAESQDGGASSYADKVRSQMNTTDEAAIMGRFYAAVSWRNEE